MQPFPSEPMQRYTFNLSDSWAEDTGVQAVTVVAKDIATAVEALERFSNWEAVVFDVVSVVTTIDVSEEARRRLRDDEPRPAYLTGIRDEGLEEMEYDADPTSFN